MMGDETQQKERNKQRRLELVHEQMNADGRACSEVKQDVQYLHTGSIFEHT